MMKNLFIRRVDEDDSNDVRGPIMKDPVTGEVIPFETITEDISKPVQSLPPDGSIPEDMPNGNPQEIIDIFYNADNIMGLKNTSRSIYKVEEFLATMPATLPTQIKLQTVYSVLVTSGFDPQDLITDGQTRMSYLSGCRDSYIRNNLDQIEKRDEKIKSLQAEIETLQAEILEMRRDDEDTDKAVNAEIDRIQKLVQNVVTGSGKPEGV